MIEALTNSPAVKDAAGVSVAPFTIAVPTTTVIDEVTGAEHLAQRRDVTETYFRTLGIPVVAGRTFSASDRAAGNSVVVSSEFAQRLGGGTVVGRRLIWGSLPLEILGVVGETRQQMTQDEPPTMYLLNSRVEHINYFVARITGDTTGFLGPMKQIIETQDPSFHVSMTAVVSDLMAQSMADERFSAFMSILFAGVALGLAGLGVFVLTTYLVTVRRQDTAVRIALGAAPGDIRRLLSRELGTVVGLGSAFGIPLGYAASLVVQKTAVGASSSLWVLPSVVGVLWLAASAAAVIPVRRAGQIDVLRVLRD